MIKLRFKITLTIFILLLKSTFCQKVVDIYDGDTFQLEDGSKVRMIGINAPEKKDIYGMESKTHLENLILNRDVILLNDDLSSDTDRYQRKLRYVYVDGTDINNKMIEDGFAFAYLTYNFTRSEEYKNSQLKSKEIGNGMWGNGQIQVIIEEQESDTKKLNTKHIVLALSLLLILFICGYTIFSK